jgi:hypothetical protein
MTSDGWCKPQSVLKWSPLTPKFIIEDDEKDEERREIRNCESYYCSPLAGYSLSYVDENKTNQHKYHRILLYIPVASVQSYIYIVLYPNAEIISNPTFPSALGSNLGNIRRIIDLYIMYETI